MLDTPVKNNARNIIRQLPTCLLVINTNYQIIGASDKWKKTFLTNTLYVYGKNLFSLVPELDKGWKKFLLDCFKGNTITLGKQQTYLKEKKKYFEWKASPFYDENENIIGAIIEATDVSNIVHSPNNPATKETLLVKQLQVLNIGRWEYDILNNQFSCCTIAKKNLSIPENSELSVNNFLDVFLEDTTRNALSKTLLQPTEKDEPWEFRLQLDNKNSNNSWVHISGTSVYEDNNIIKIVGTLKDINEQVFAEVYAKQGEQFVKEVLELLPVHVYVNDLDSKRTITNRAEFEYLGVKSNEEAVGKGDHDFLSKEYADFTRKQDLEIISTLKPIVDLEQIAIDKNGKETPFIISKTPFINEQGTLIGIINTCINISKSKQTENELRGLISITSRQNKKLLNFAHIVSHNLRSHSSNFSMLLNFLKTERNEVEKNRLLSMLTQASDKLLETLENLNDVVSLNTSALATLNDIDVNETLATIQESQAVFLKLNKVTISNKLPKKFNVKATSHYLESILSNLITNAIKYKHPERNPEITITGNFTGQHKTISITDNGLGIDLNKHGNKLFGMYKSFHKHTESNSMGLYVSKNQMEAMNGKIEVSSIVGEGSEFKLYFHERD